MCVCDTVRTDENFAGWNDYDSFRRAIRADREFVEVPVLAPYSNVGLVEEWYRCARCQTTWRLVEPDPPFAGLWKKVGQ